VPSDMLNDLRLCEELFHTPGGVAYADLMTNGHRETWPIRSKSFQSWVRRCYYRATGTAAGAAVLGPALNLLEARAQFDGPERVVHTRVAEHSGRLYLDLADEHWRAVGSSKTILSKLLRALVDPNLAPVRALPREKRDLILPPIMATCSPSIICPACPPGSRMHSVGLRAAAVSRSGSSIRMMKRCCSKRRVVVARRRSLERSGSRSRLVVRVEPEIGSSAYGRAAMRPAVPLLPSAASA
jgi:hypothetical protein